MVISLIEVVTGFVSGSDFDFEIQAMLVNEYRRGGRNATQQTVACG
jgi:hypothetical protein